MIQPIASPVKEWNNPQARQVFMMCLLFVFLEATEETSGVNSKEDRELKHNLLMAF